MKQTDLVIDIDDVEYRLTDEAQRSLSAGAGKVAVVRLYDRVGRLFDRGIIVQALKRGVIDELDRRRGQDA